MTSKAKELLPRRRERRMRMLIQMNTRIMCTFARHLSVHLVSALAHMLVLWKTNYHTVKVGCKWAASKLFPWKNLPRKLAKSGVVCYNYLDNVLFPGEEQQSHSKGGLKGISDLTLSKCSTLIAVLGDTSKDRLYFKEASSKLKGKCHENSYH